MRAIIIEDENLSVIELEKTLAAVAPDIEVIAVAGTVREAVSILRNSRYDLVFMDIHLGDGNSFTIFDQVEVTAPVIFITAYDEYAIKAFEHNGIGYILKPFTEGDIKKAIDKLSILGQSRDQGKSVGGILPSQTKERYLLTKGDRIRSVPVTDIAYLMADGKYVEVTITDGEVFLTDKSLQEFETELPGDIFFRINRKFIISIGSISDMLRYSGSRIKLTLNPPPRIEDDTVVSSDRSRDFRNWLDR